MSCAELLKKMKQIPLNEALSYSAKAYNVIRESEENVLMGVFNLVDTAVETLYTYVENGYIEADNLASSILLAIGSLEKIVKSEDVKKLLSKVAEIIEQYVKLYDEAEAKCEDEETEDLAEIFEDDIEEAANEDEDEGFFDASLF